MTRYPEPKSNKSLSVHANDEGEQTKIRGFKEVCLRDGLEQRQEIMKLIDHFLREHNWPPGNPQTQLFDPPPKKKEEESEWVYNRETGSIYRRKNK